MTAEELLAEIDDCYGPCTKICVSCPEQGHLKEIRDVIVRLLAENKELKYQLESLMK